ncbi:hypothetical protein CEXT_511521 [Caerostris extrusa]|uniref:Uncharacterized protein n=1 Tax=Caerostris extrusa TaxID=172846 RepID=A0AAV4SKR8_CAEEX|nr:hypothetical protein CEXT_511521 [Caerostris extrusa]
MVAKKKELQSKPKMLENLPDLNKIPKSLSVLEMKEIRAPIEEPTIINSNNIILQQTTHGHKLWKLNPLPDFHHNAYNKGSKPSSKHTLPLNKLSFEGDLEEFESIVQFISK